MTKATYELEVDWNGDGALGTERSGNLCANGSFETNTTGWTTLGTNTIVRSNERAKYGDYSLKATYQDNSVLGSFGITLTNAAHSLGVWVYIPSNYDGTNVRVNIQGFTGLSGGSPVSADMSIRDAWQFVANQNWTPASGDLTGNLRVVEGGTAPTAGRFIYIDGVRCEQAAAATVFSLENVTDVMAIECMRGADHASQLTGEATAGRLSAVLRNLAGDYSPLNSSSPLAGNILPGRRVRLRVHGPTAGTLWTGFLDRIEPHVVVGPFNTATLYASGPLIKLSGQNSKVNPPAMADADTGEIIDAILDAAGFPAGDRQIDTDGIELRRWYVEDKVALDAIHEIEETEGGFFYEGTAWDVAFETRYHRFLNNLVSQATFSDAPAATLSYEEIEESDVLREIFNYFEATVQPYALGALAVLWTLNGESPVLVAGESRTYIAKATSLDGSQVAVVDAWTTPVVGTDITQAGVSNGDIGVSVAKKARSMEITITNNHGSAAATLTLVQARGVPVLAQDPFKISAADATSQTAYGKRSFPLPSPWYPNAAHAEGAANFYIDQYKDPQAFLSLAFTASKSDDLLEQAVTRTISDRLTVEAENAALLGINQDFHIESIYHRIAPGPLHQVRYELSPAEADPGWWVLGVSDDLDTDTVLAY